jgi:hypothetical protein
MTWDEVIDTSSYRIFEIERPGKLVNMLVIMKNSSSLLVTFINMKTISLDLSQVKCSYFRLRLTREIYYPALLII